MSLVPPHPAYSHRLLVSLVPRTLESFPKAAILVQDRMDLFAPFFDPSLLRRRFVQLAADVDVEFVEVAVGPAEGVLDETVEEVEIVVRGDTDGSVDFCSG